MPSPFLLIRRLVVEGELSCDIKLGPGLNVVRAFSTDPMATNNAGKSTFVELIQHGLGKRQESKAKWYLSPIMGQINDLFLEVQLNGEVFTIERSLQNINAAATIREMAYEPDIRRVPGQKVDVEEMSDWFLAKLNIPVVAVTTTSGRLDPLSFRQIMRAFVLNQSLSFSAILNKVMPEQRIPDIIGFLTGITPLERFALESSLSVKQREAQTLESYFINVNRFFLERNTNSIEEVKSHLEKARENLETAKKLQLLAQMKISEQVKNQAKFKDNGRIEQLRLQSLNLKEEIAQVKHNLTNVIHEESHLDALLSSLKTDRQRVQRLRTSSFILNSVDFGACPRCLQAITDEMKAKEEYGRCSLCSRPLATTSDSIPKVVPRIDDIDLQIEEVQSVVQNTSFEKSDLERKLEILQKTEAEISDVLDFETRAFISPSVDQLLEHANEVARCEADLATAELLYRQVREVGTINENLRAVNEDKANIEKKLKNVKKSDSTRLEEFRQIVEYILREVKFPDLVSFSIDAQKLVPLINGVLYRNVGAAYTSLIVVCYHLGLLELARRESTFFPSFLIIDSPNVHDINESSEHELLKYLVRLATEKDENKSNDWQIILTTREMVDGLEQFVKVKVSRENNQMLLRRKQ